MAKARRTGRGARALGASLAGAGALLALAVPAQAGDGTFAAAVPTSVGTSPTALAVADLNGDGVHDLATANFSAATVSILLGNGTGGFTGSGSPAPVGNNPVSVAVADLDNDGDQDLVAVKGGPSGSVSVLRGDGTGGFSAPTSTGVGSAPRSVAVADLDDDDDQDVVTANFLPGTVSVLLGDGDGGFGGPATSTSVGGGPNSVAVADLNNDGKQDLVTANYAAGAGTVSVLLGNGTGGFGAVTSTSVGGFPASVAVADLNNDGNQDLVTANSATAGTVSVLLGNGTGGFSGPATSTAVGGAPVSVAVADLNNDGNQDVVTANSNAAGTVSVLLGNGTGGFSGPAAAASVGNRPSSVAVVDLNGDGNQDLATANFDANTVSVLLGNGASPGLGNLLVNPGAEGSGAAGTLLATPAVPGWTATAGAPTFARYASPRFPGLIDSGRWAGGTNLFSGGTAPVASAQQTVSLATQSASVDAGLARATLSGLLGGSAARTDAASLSATFLGAAAQSLGAPITIGPVTATDRRNQTILLRRSASAPIPVGTRSIRVTMSITGAGSYNDGYLDDLSLRVSAPAPVITTGPPLAPRPLCKGKPATIVATTRITRGTRKADVIVGRAGSDVIRALGGNDIVCGRGGADRIDGGRGADTLLGQAGRDTLIGGAGRDRLLGGAGRDLLRGGLGLDRLLGGPGLDRQLQ